MFKSIVLVLALVLFSVSGLHADNKHTPKVYFLNLVNGDIVSSPLTIRFGLKGMGVAPAGVERDKTGHHHLIIDAPLPDLSQPIPMDAHYRHFGGGQTEVTIELEKGQHTLQLLLGDAFHTPHTHPLYSDQINITVK